MPLVFVHGVATRPSLAYAAEVLQRNALFRTIVLNNDATIENPDWGSHAVSFTEPAPWLPEPKGNQAYGAGGAISGDPKISLGTLAQTNVAQAVDLAIAGMLEQAVQDAESQNTPTIADQAKFIALAKAAADYLDKQQADETPKGDAALATPDNATFAAALESRLKQNSDLQGYGAIGDAISGGFSAVGGWIGTGLSDAALKAKRKKLSTFVAYFLGDIFVYLRQRDIQGAHGVRERIFKPILTSLIAAHKAARAPNEPYVVVGHSLGGVILFDLLSDPEALAQLDREAPGLKIDLLATVGSQPGFFADLKLYAGKPVVGEKLATPNRVAVWHNVYDYTDVFSFLAAPMFEGVTDYSYDSAVDLMAAHTAYFKKPSFYQRLRARLKSLGHL